MSDTAKENNSSAFFWKFVILYKRWRVIVAVFFLSLLSASAYAFFYSNIPAKTAYQSHATLQIGKTAKQVPLESGPAMMKRLTEVYNPHDVVFENNLLTVTMRSDTPEKTIALLDKIVKTLIEEHATRYEILNREELEEIKKYKEIEARLEKEKQQPTKADKEAKDKELERLREKIKLAKKKAAPQYQMLQWEIDFNKQNLKTMEEEIKGISDAAARIKDDKSLSSAFAALKEVSLKFIENRNRAIYNIKAQESNLAVKMIEIEELSTESGERRELVREKISEKAPIEVKGKQTEIVVPTTTPEEVIVNPPPPFNYKSHFSMVSALGLVLGIIAAFFAEQREEAIKYLARRPA